MAHNKRSTLRGGADVDVDVPLDYTVPDINADNNRVTLKPNSHYSIDYIIYYYEYLIKITLEKDPDATGNSNFRLFMQKVSELAVNVDHERKDGGNNYGSDDPAHSYKDHIDELRG